jgi:hypothetical protein
VATNDFLVFAGAGGSNVITQAQYLALLAETTGFQSGIASSAQANKVWRQSSIMSSMIGQFIADKSGNNATDDGTTATLEANFIAALQAVTFVKLNATLNLYVNPSTGLDTNVGTSPSLPFKTIQAAINASYVGYNFNNNQLIINLASGTYNGTIQFQGMPIGCQQITILGNPSSPASVVISVTNANAISLGGSAFIALNGISIAATGTSTLVTGLGFGLTVLQAYCAVTNCIFNTCTSVQVQSWGGSVTTLANSTFQGSAQYGIVASVGGLIWANGTTLTFNSPSYSTANFSANQSGSLECISTTLSGTATGQRFVATTNGVISTNAAGPNFIPGSVAGATGTGGQYV